jgi:glucans biosynthesis protein
MTELPNNPTRPTDRLNAAPRCGARTRKGTPCQQAAVRGKPRCRMHGGAKGSGAPKGNRNAWKHGRWSREAIEARRSLIALIRTADATRGMI